MTAKSISMAIGLTMVCNVFYLASSYIVKNKSVPPGEVTVFSGSARILIFGSWSLIDFLKKRRQQKKQVDEGEYTRREWLYLIAGNFVMAVMIISCYASVRLMPFSDFVTFAFTSAIFTLFFHIATNT